MDSFAPGHACVLNTPDDRGRYVSANRRRQALGGHAEITPRSRRDHARDHDEITPEITPEILPLHPGYTV